MKDIKILRDGVIDKITRQGDAKVEAKEQAIQEELSAYSAQSDSQKDKDLERIAQGYKDLLSQNKQSYNNQKRNDLLGVKEGIIAEVLQAALERLQSFDGGQLLPFVEQAIAQIDKDKAHTIKFGDQTKDKLSQEHLDQIKGHSSNIHISDETVSRASGFVVEQDGIEYNYLFEDLIQEIEPELKVDISREVF